MISVYWQYYRMFNQHPNINPDSDRLISDFDRETTINSLTNRGSSDGTIYVDENDALAIWAGINPCYEDDLIWYLAEFDIDISSLNAEKLAEVVWNKLSGAEDRIEFNFDEADRTIRWLVDIVEDYYQEVDDYRDDYDRYGVPRGEL